MVKLGLLITLGGIGAIGAGVLSYFNQAFYDKLVLLQPSTYTYGLVGLAMIVYSTYKIQQSGWEEAKPNEWLVIIENGKQVKAGVGLVCYRRFYQTAIKFPSAVQKVNFNAMQVCEEMQGLRIQGFAVWSVHRDQPFLYYKQMHGINANQSIRKVCESIVRHEIANASLETVITQRDILRDKMREQLQKVFTGWGVWLETVEITEVTICSNSLFEDMQAPSKQENYLKSEKYKLKINTEMQIDAEKSDLIIQKQQLEKETQRQEYYYQQQIKKLQQEAEFKKKNIEIEKLKQKQEGEYDLEQLKKNFELKKKQLLDQQEITKKQNDAVRQQKLDEIKAEQQISEINMQKYRLEKQSEIMQNIKLKRVDVHSYSSKDENFMSQIIPQITGKKAV